MVVQDAPKPLDGIFVLVVEDSNDWWDIINEALKNTGTNVARAEDGKSAINMIRKNEYDLVLLDLMLPPRRSLEEGLDILREIKIKPTSMVRVPEFIVVTVWGDLPTVVEAIRLGATDFIPKDTSEGFGDYLIERMIKAVEDAKILERLENLQSYRAVEHGEIIAESAAMRNVIEEVEQIAQNDSTVLIVGEKGTGKELVARLIHRLSKRKKGPFVTVNCASIPETLIASELFGYSPKSGIAGADPKGKAGRFELAHGGTIFLDEISKMNMQAQGSILRVIEYGEVWRLSAIKHKMVNVRILAATNRNLEQEVKRELFLDDLYDRLNVIKVSVPPLREHPEDIIPLFWHFLRTWCAREDMQRPIVTETLQQRLKTYHWPGNARQVKNATEGMLAKDKDGRLDIEDIPEELELSDNQSNIDTGNQLADLKNLTLESEPHLEKSAEVIRKILFVPGRKNPRRPEDENTKRYLGVVLQKLRAQGYTWERIKNVIGVSVPKLREYSKFQ